MKKSKLRKALIIVLSCIMALSLSACNLTINGKQVFGEKNESGDDEVTKTKKDDKKSSEENSEERDTGHIKVSDEEARDLLTDAIDTLKKDNFIYLLESSTKDTNGDDLAINSVVYINNSNGTAVSYYVANGKDTNGNDATQETVNTFRQDKSDLTWTVDESVLTFEEESETQNIGKAETFFNIIFADADKNLFNVKKEVNTYGPNVVYKSDKEDFKITLDMFSKKIESIEYKSGEDVNKYEFLYESDAEKEFREAYKKLNDKCAESDLEYSDILKDTVSNTNTKETDVTKETESYDLDVTSIEVDGKKLVLDAFDKLQSEKCYVDMMMSMEQTGTNSILEADIYGLYNFKEDTSLVIASGSMDGNQENVIGYTYKEGSSLISKMTEFDSTEVSDEELSLNDYNLKLLLSDMAKGTFTVSDKSYKIGDELELEIIPKNNEGQHIYATLDNETNRLISLDMSGEQDGVKLKLDYIVAYPGTDDFDSLYELFIDDLNRHNKALDVTEYLNEFSSSKTSSIGDDVITKKETESYTNNIEETKESKVSNNSGKSEYTLEAEKEIEGCLGKKVSDFTFEHCSYDFAEAGTMYQPREKTKIKLTYTDFGADGKTEKVYKTLTLENKSNNEVGISEMTVISIE